MPDRYNSSLIRGIGCPPPPKMETDTVTNTEPPPDSLTRKIGVLMRREVEARILAPVIEAITAAIEA